jgi:hypothetical protein
LEGNSDAKGLARPIEVAGMADNALISPLFLEAYCEYPRDEKP